jgi:uncharacterized protein YcbX
VAVLTRINVTALKGTALEHPERVALTAEGVVGDRRLFLIDERGELFSVHDFGPLMQVHAAYDPDAGSLSLSFPDGSVTDGPVDARGGVMTTDFHGRPVSGIILGGPFAAALSAYVGQDVRLVRTDREGTGTDVHPLTVVSQASVRELARRGGYDGDLDARRFRMTLELDGTEPFEEDTWAGRSVQVGDAVLRLHGPVPRCRVTTFAPATGMKDWDTLTQIASFRPLMSDERGIPFGMYAQVERPGDAGVGSPVELLADGDV